MFIYNNQYGGFLSHGAIDHTSSKSLDHLFILTPDRWGLGIPPFWETHISSPTYHPIHQWLKNSYPIILRDYPTTSSTAQGGGGSFKNRKPIGEIDCCESRMAERIHWLTERWLELCLLEWLQWLQWSPHPQLLDVVWCTATVVVVVA